MSSYSDLLEEFKKNQPLDDEAVARLKAQVTEICNKLGRDLKGYASGTEISPLVTALFNERLLFPVRVYERAILDTEHVLAEVKLSTKPEYNIFVALLGKEVCVYISRAPEGGNLR